VLIVTKERPVEEYKWGWWKPKPFIKPIKLEEEQDEEIDEYSRD